MRARPQTVPVLAAALALATAGCGGHAQQRGRDVGSSASASTPASPAGGAVSAALAIPKSASKAATKAATQLAPATVATVAGQPITLAQYRASYRAELAAFPGGPPAPPRYARCIGALRSQFAKIAKRMRASSGSKLKPAIPAAAKLRDQCAQRVETARQTAILQLIEATWIAQEAKAESVTVSPQELRSALAREEKSLRLASPHVSRTELRDRIRLQLLNEKLERQRLGAPVNVSDGDVARYFNEHRARFGLPERRNVEVIVTKTEAQANAAKRAVAKGMAWSAAVDKWSVDRVTKASGGQLAGIIEAGQDPALGRVLFGTRPGALTGPVKTERGWYVARVTRVIPATNPQLAAYKARIRMLLEGQARARRAAAGQQAFERRWRARTVCRAGYVVALCANARTRERADSVISTPAAASGASAGQAVTRRRSASDAVQRAGVSAWRCRVARSRVSRRRASGAISSSLQS